MITCEYPECDGEKTCFHYCAKHHKSICIDGGVIDFESCENRDYEESEIEASFDYCGNFMNVDKARAELARLRAAASEADALRATVVRQQLQIEIARDVISKDHGASCPPDCMGGIWLASNVPLPAPEAEQHFNSARKYREALERIEAAWVGESVADEHISALKMYTIAARALNNADDEIDNANAPEAERERTP